MKNLLLCFLIIAGMSSCQKDDLYYDVRTEVCVFISDNNNRDLLSQNISSSNTIDLQKLEIVSSGNNNAGPSPAQGRMMPDILSPNFFSIDKKDGKRCLRLLFNPLYSQSLLEIKYNNGLKNDTLIADLENINGKIFYNKIYLGKALVWERSKDKERSIQIVKN